MLLRLRDRFTNPNSKRSETQRFSRASLSRFPSNTGASLLVTFQNAARQRLTPPTFQKGRIVVHQSGSGQSGSFKPGYSPERNGLRKMFSDSSKNLSNPLFLLILNFNHCKSTEHPLPADNGREANSMAIFAGHAARMIRWRVSPSKWVIGLASTFHL